VLASQKIMTMRYVNLLFTYLLINLLSLGVRNTHSKVKIYARDSLLFQGIVSVGIWPKWRCPRIICGGGIMIVGLVISLLSSWRDRSVDGAVLSLVLSARRSQRPKSQFRAHFAHRANTIITSDNETVDRASVGSRLSRSRRQFPRAGVPGDCTFPNSTSAPLVDIKKSKKHAAWLPIMLN